MFRQSSCYWDGNILKRRDNFSQKFIVLCALNGYCKFQNHNNVVECIGGIVQLIDFNYIRKDFMQVVKRCKQISAFNCTSSQRIILIVFLDFETIVASTSGLPVFHTFIILFLFTSIWTVVYPFNYFFFLFLNY